MCPCLGRVVEWVLPSIPPPPLNNNNNSCSNKCTKTVLIGLIMMQPGAVFLLSDGSHVQMNVTIPINASTFIRLSTDPATIRILSGLRTWKRIRWSCDHSASQRLLLTLTRLSLTRQQQLMKEKGMIQFPWNYKVMVTM